MTELQELIQSWDGEYVVTQFDQSTGAWIFVAIHSGALGTPTGGTRLKTYPRPGDALQDAMRLAEGMTQKWAVVDFPKGGGKAVLNVPSTLSPSDRQSLLKRYAELLEQLHGAFETGPDLGTTPADMDLIGQHTSYVFGKTPTAGGAGEAGRFTAMGVYYGILASADYVWGSRDLSERCVLVQGAGSVGGHLIRLLSEAGARVKFTDVDAERVGTYHQMSGTEFVELDAVYGEGCDIFAPCATGGILNPESIPQLRCRIIAGAANNQLSTSKDAAALTARNILYAPDFVINAGAAIALPALERMGWTEEQVDRRLQGIGDKLLEIFRLSEQERIATAEVARKLAKQRLSIEEDA
jgi:leucine dehydrogenase